MIAFKPNVRIKKYNADLVRAMFHIHEIRNELIGPELEMVITSWNDSAHTHRAGSEHGEDNAFDFRSHDLDRESKHHLLAMARSELQECAIILESEGTENEHFHCQSNFNGIAGYEQNGMWIYPKS